MNEKIKEVHGVQAHSMKKKEESMNRMSSQISKKSCGKILILTHNCVQKKRKWQN